MVVTDVTDVTTQMLPHQRNEPQEETEKRMFAWVETSIPQLELLGEHRQRVAQTLNEGLQIIKRQLRNDEARQRQITHLQELNAEQQQKIEDLEMQIANNGAPSANATDAYTQVAFGLMYSFIINAMLKMLHDTLHEYSQNTDAFKQWSSIIFVVLICIMTWKIGNLPIFHDKTAKPEQKSEPQEVSVNAFLGGPSIKIKGSEGLRSLNMFMLFLFVVVMYSMITSYMASSSVFTGVWNGVAGLLDGLFGK